MLATLPPCPACDGRGVYYASFKFHKTCPACGGTRFKLDGTPHTTSEDKDD